MVIARTIPPAEIRYHHCFGITIVITIETLKMHEIIKIVIFSFEFLENLG